MTGLNTYHLLGKIDDNIITNTNFENNGNVYVAPGLLKHIKKHLNEFSSKEKNDILKTMKTVFISPDYIGEHPKKIGQSIELIKICDHNILISIEIDKHKNYNYISSMYVIADSKLKNRLYSGRIVPLDISMLEVATTQS